MKCFLQSRCVISCSGVLLAMVLGMVAHADPDRVQYKGEPSPEALEQVIPDEDSARRVVLENGFELVLVSNQETDADARDQSQRRAQQDQLDTDTDTDGRGGQAWLIVRAGSLYETDAQRGAARVVEHVIRMGSTHFSSEQIDQILRRQSGSHGDYDGSIVGFDQTVFMAGIDPKDPQELGKALAFFGDVLAGRGVLDGMVGDESQDDLAAGSAAGSAVRLAVSEVIEAAKTESNPELRSRRQWLPRVFAGTVFGARLPMARIDQLSALSLDAVGDFAQSRYQPSNATLIVVGDFDPDAIVELAKKTIGRVGGGPRGQWVDRGGVIDGRLKGDISMRAAIGTDPGFENDQSALVWMRDRGGDVTRAWSVRAKRYTTGDMRALVISRVAGEIVRHRLGRLSVQEFGVGAELMVDEIDLWGQVDLTQLVLEGEGIAWEESMAFLTKQAHRLTRDGALAQEIERARRSVLSKWHRDADDWAGLEAAHRIGLVHWLVTTGRPVIDMVRWDQMATDLMGSIGDDEINAAVRGMVDPNACAYIALKAQQDPSDQTPHADDQGLVLRVVRDALSRPIAAIDPGWMEALGDSLINAPRPGGTIEEISVHPGGDIWDAKLGNGVRVLARRVEQTQGGISLSATVWGPVLDVALVGEEELSAAMLAWEMPRTESRSTQAIAAYLDDHQLGLEIKRDTGYIQLSVYGSKDQAAQAVELMYAVLDKPMIDENAFQNWQQGWASRKIDPVDVGLTHLYRVSKMAHQRSQGHVTLDQAQRALTQIVRNGQIDIAIAGDIDTEEAIELSREYFGALVKRTRQARGYDGEILESSIPGSTRSMRVLSDDVDTLGFVSGYVGSSDMSLRQVRALVLASMVLNGRLKSLPLAHGTTVRAQLASSDALIGRVLFMTRVWSASEGKGNDDATQQLIDDALGELLDEGIQAQELLAIQRRLNESIGRYFSTPMYWSKRLSVLAINDLRVDDLWGIRREYMEITPAEVVGALNTIIAANEHFRIEIAERDARKEAP